VARCATIAFVVAVCLALALVFGGLDQYVGSFSAHPWGADVSGLSAPWLILPFVVGAGQRTVRRAVWLGLGCTMAALVGYLVMTFSPVENAHPTYAGVLGFLRGGNLRWFAAGALTGPLFGWLGHRWRTRRTVLAGLAAAVVVCLEPWARAAYGNVIRSSAVTAGEVAAGAAFGVLVAVRAAVGRRRGSAVPGEPGTAA
jgi:hypothetical protein